MIVCGDCRDWLLTRWMAGCDAFAFIALATTEISVTHMPTEPSATSTSTLLYLCGVASSVNKPTTHFTNRGLLQLTVGRLSQLQIVGKPIEQQFAYGGYKSCIEHFVAATAYKRKILTSSESLPLPEDYTPKCPLKLPSLIVRTGKAIKKPMVDKLFEKLQPEGMAVVQAGGEPGTCFEILEPSWVTVFGIGPAAFNRQCARLDSRAQFGDLLLFKPIYQFIDLFLATNTYPYKKSEYRTKSVEGSKEVNKSTIEVRTHDTLWREHFGDKATANKKVKLDFGETRDGAIGKDEPVDETPNCDTRHAMHQTVFVAKPSPYPVSTSFGSPSSVPNTGGLCFPYFAGLLQHDLPGTRDMIGRIMFRCLGDSKTSPREAYLRIRSAMGSVLNTDAGLELTHIIKGIDLALDTQTQLYLLYDKRTYLGFCLLGEEFSVFVHGKWHSAEAPDTFRKTLAGIYTSEEALNQLATKISAMSVEMDGLDSITADNLRTPYDILAVLKKLTLADADEGKEQEREIFELVGKCNMSGEYKAITPENVKWALNKLAAVEGDFDKDIPIYIPSSGWSDIDMFRYPILAAFGSRSFSLRNTKGDELSIVDPATKEKHKWLEMDGKREAYPLMVYMKGIHECVADYGTFVEKGRVRCDYTERAGGVRAHKWYGERKKVVWAALWENKAAYGKGVQKEDKGKGKEKAKVVDDEGDEDALAKFLK